MAPARAPAPAPEEHAALILRAVPYRDADLVVTLLTPSHGRLGALAKSARASRKRFAGGLHPGSLLRAELVARQHGLASLRGGRLLYAPTGAARALERFSGLAATLDLARALTPEALEDVPGFEDASETVRAIAGVADPWDAFFGYTLRLLVRQGVAPELDACVERGTPLPDGRPALFDPEKGGVVSRAAGGGPIRLSADALAAMRRAISGEPATFAASDRRAILDALLTTARARSGARLRAVEALDAYV